MDPDDFLGCSDNLMPLLWSLVVSEITVRMISFLVGYTVTFSLPHSIISHLPSLPLLLLFAGQVHFMKNTILSECVQVLGKNISVYKKGN